jgi:hypothetical protein
MSMTHQVQNLLQIISHHQGNKLIVNTIFANSLFDITLQELDDYVFIDHKTIKSKDLSYGATLINNPIAFANDISYIKNMYSNKIVLMHENIFSGLKKEDQYLLFTSIKDYTIFSFIPNIPLQNNNVNYIKYGFKSNISQLAADRNTDVLVLYNNDQRQAEMLFQMVKGVIPNSEIVNIKNIQSIDMMNNLFNNTKVCIDLSSYYNTLYSVSCGCFGITKSESYDPNFITTIHDVTSLLPLLQQILSSYNDNYIYGAQKYIESNYDYATYESNMKAIIEQISNSAIIP